MELTKVSKLLIAVEESTIRKFSGKELNQVNVDAYIASNKTIKNNSENVEETNDPDDSNEVNENIHQFKSRKTKERINWDVNVKLRAKDFFYKDISHKKSPGKEKVLETGKRYGEKYLYNEKN